jgi:DNA-binding NarL/FixJ family response regulator
VLLADDHEAVRAGLRLLLESTGEVEVVGETGDGRAAVDAARALSPDVVVLDLSMEGMSGLEATRVMRREGLCTPIVVLTRHSEWAYVSELFSAGASAYVLKQSAFAELLTAVKTAASGRTYVDRAAASPLSARADGGAPSSDTGTNVTEREVAVLQLAASGRSNKDIAGTLDIAVKTVEVHKSNAMRKLRLRDRADLLRFAVVKGWLHDP